jgi:glucose-1-phosphate adenylyltransferase
MTQPQPYLSVNTHNVLAVILGGGRGARLFPLTKDRSKPAVPLGGKYRLVDIPISNCINSGLLRVYLLTQFNSASLHRHISQSYKFDHFSGGFIEILAAEQTPTDTSWYQGTADAVRKNMVHFLNNRFDYLLVLSGDQLYRMDYRHLIAQHIATKADVTVATMPVPRKDIAGLGIMKLDPDYRITDFVEKPQDPAVQEGLKLAPEWEQKLKLPAGQEHFLASMGIYVFNRKAIFELLGESQHDFGKDVIPRAIHSHRVCAYVFQGEWEDIGTIRAFFECNLDLASSRPHFNVFDLTAPLFTRPRFLPASRIDGGSIEQSLVADGCILDHADISQSVVGLRSLVGPGSRLERVVMMGSDFYETQDSIERHRAEGKPRIGIGRNTRIGNAIIDKNARVGDDCVISPAGKPKEVDQAFYFIRDGIIIIPKNALVPHGTKI